MLSFYKNIMFIKIIKKVFDSKHVLLFNWLSDLE